MEGMANPTKSSSRAPFDDEDADIIFRSADSVDFHLYKVILAKASSVFRDMLTLPDIDAPGAAQVVSMSEDADTLESLLRFCYPVDRPVFDSLDRLGPVLAAAKKYNMPTVLRDILCGLQAFLDTSPALQVYLLACAYELPKIARRAARRLLGDADPHALLPEPMPPEFRTLPCETMYVFGIYRKKCIAEALPLVDDKEWWLSGSHTHRMAYSNKGNPHRHTTWVWLACDSCAADYSWSVWAARKSGGAMLYPRLWFTRYITQVRDLLHGRPVGAVVTEPAVVKEAVNAAASCSTCAAKAHEHLAEFSQALMVRIDAALDNITLKLPSYVYDDDSIDEVTSDPY